MTCDEIRSALRTGGDGAWPSAVIAHLATCAACVDAAIDHALTQGPSGRAPTSFAVDVARAARLSAPPPRRRSRALIAGIAGAVAAVSTPALLLTNTDNASVPAAVFALACAVGLAVSVATLDADVVRPRFRG